MKHLIFTLTFITLFVSGLKADENNPSKIYSKVDIEKISDLYVHNNLKIENPAIVDVDGDGDLDMFAVKDKGYNKLTRQNEYNVYTAENALDLDTGTLITIILVLVIVLLVLAILR